MKSLRPITGTHGEYQWLTTGEHDLDTLLRACPQAFLGKWIAVTSLDSGPLVLNADEKSSGWKSRNGIAYSPEVWSPHESLPHGECGGFDEWYVFENPTDLGAVVHGNVFEGSLAVGQVRVFVNFGTFGLHAVNDLVERFWDQLPLIRPESYVADGDYLNFVSRNKDIFGMVCTALAESAPKS